MTTKEKEKFWQQPEKNDTLYIQGNNDLNNWSFLIRHNGGQITTEQHFKSVERKKLSTENPIPNKNIPQGWNEVKTLKNKTRQKQTNKKKTTKRTYLQYTCTKKNAKGSSSGLGKWDKMKT